MTTEKTTQGHNEHDVEVVRLQTDLSKYEADLALKVAEWRTEFELKHKKFMRVTEAVEKTAIVALVGGTILYAKKQNIELAKYTSEYGGV